MLRWWQHYYVARPGEALDYFLGWLEEKGHEASDVYRNIAEHLGGAGNTGRSAGDYL